METRFQPVKDQWPPNQLTTIVNVALIHLEGEQTQQELIDMSMYNIPIEEKLSLHHPRVTKRIIDIFKSSSHKRILIEGAPGIGKTVLTREIAYCWANGKILIDKKLFLLFIRDPNLHCVKSINDLAHYLNDGYLTDGEAEVAAGELRKSSGLGIVFVIDGYDECPCDSKLKGFIDKLVEKRLLPMCVVVITSRPTASLLLRQLADQRIEILGLAEKEQEQYILESLKGSPEMITKLQQHLKQQPIINSLLYVPLHLAVLLYLFKQDSLPETLTELNEYFIIHTIYRHLTKQRQLSFIKINKITDLPEPELTIVYQLSKLAYKGLCNSQIVFTYDEVKEVCPKVDETPGAISGFGLLQAVVSYHWKGPGKILSLNFLHFTMQEYLAALYVSTLPSEEQSSLIKNIFWDGHFNFMWIMYMGIVGPHLISHMISESLYEGIYKHLSFNQSQYNIPARKSLFIFQCYLEGKNLKLIPEGITAIFSDGNINLSKVTLLPHHIMSLTVFMMRSTTQWKSLNLDSCSIGNKGMSILAKFFMDFKEMTITIKYLNLRNNNLTSLWGTYTITVQDNVNAYSELLQSVEDLDISLNFICDRSISEYLKVNSSLCKLNLSKNNITDDGAKLLAEAIQVNTILQELNICKNEITDEGAKMFAEAIGINTTLQNLNMSQNKITDKGAKRLAEAIVINKTLQELNISKNWMSKEGIMRIVEACTKNRTLHKLVCTHNNLSKSELVAINEYIRKEDAVQIFDASWNTIGVKGDQLAIKAIFQSFISKAAFQLSGWQQKLLPGGGRSYGGGVMGEELWYMGEELWYFDEIDELNYRREFLQCCLEENQCLNVQNANLSDMFHLGIIIDCLKLNKNITKVNLCSCQVTCEGIKVLVPAIEVSTTLQHLDISNNAISDDGFLSITNLLMITYTLCKMNLSGNEIGIEGTVKLSEAIKVNTTLQVLSISKNKITNDGVKIFAEAIEMNTTLRKLNISKNWISKEGVMRIVEACTINRTLHKLVCTHNNLSKFELAAINEYIRKENAVQIFEASWNTIGATIDRLVIKTIFQYLDICKISFQLSGILQELQLSPSSTPSDARNELWYADEISEPKYRREFLLCCIEEIQHLVLQNANLSDMAQIGIISDGLRLNKKITEVNLCNCQVTCEGIKVLMQAFEVSTKLQLLDISRNAISFDGVSFIAYFLTLNHTLIQLNLSENEIKDGGIKKLSEAIQVNTTLQNLNISENKITDEGANELSKAIEVNNTVQELDISKNWISKEGVMRVVEACTINRTLHKLVCTHNNLSKSGLAAISDYIRKENAVQIFVASWNTIGAMSNQLAIKTIFQYLDIWKTSFQLSGIQQKLQSGNGTREEIRTWYADEISELKYRREFLQCYIEEIQHLNVQNANLSDMAQIGIIIDCLKRNKKITEVNLCNCRITCEGIKLLIQAVEVSSTLQNFDISRNAISADGILSITNSLMINHALFQLNLSDNKIRDKGIKKLSEAIQMNTALQILNMSRNKITDEGANELSKAIQLNRTLQELNMSENWISTEGVMRIVKACAKNRTLHKLVCTHNNLSKCGLAAINEYIRKENAVQIFDASWNTIGVMDNRLAIKTIFQYLDIWKTSFQLSGIQQKLQSGNDTREELWYADEISELKYRREFLQCCIEEIQHINVQNANLSDMTQIGTISDGLKLNKKIAEVNLCNCRVTCEGIKALVQAFKVNTILQNLDVSNNAMSNNGILSISEFLKSNSALCKLNLSGNKIRNEGIKKLSEAIKVNTTLQDLNISRNNITDEGANELSKGIQVNKMLQELNISKNWISKEGVMRIVEACTKNRTLHKLVCTHNNLSKSELAAINEYIRKENAVQILDASWNAVVARYGKLDVKIIFQLLDVSKEPFELLGSGNDTREEFWNVNRLLKYERRFIQYCIEESEHLNLQDVNLSDMFQLDIISDGLKLNKKITEVNLCNCRVTNEEIKVLVQAVEVSTTLLNIDVSKNAISDDGVLFIANFLMINHTLVQLNLSGNKISDKGIKKLSKAMQVNKKLQELNISKNWISKEGVMRIVEACTKNRTLHKLVCTHNNLSKSELAAINEYIRKENAVQILDASWNAVVARYGKLDVKIIFQLLDVSKEPFELLGSGNDTREEFWNVNRLLKYERRFIQYCIEESEHLNLQDVNLSDMFQLDIISDGLKLNKKITEVNLCNCRVTNEEIKVLVQAVEVSTTLLNIDVSKNAISDDGVLFIANFLMINHTLVQLNLSGNKISDKGIKKLSKAMQVNKKLQELNISKNWISEEGVMRIVKACTINRTLHKLVCTHNNLSKSGLVAINECIRKENAIQMFDASWNTIGSHYGRLVIKTIFQPLDISIAKFQLPDMQQILQSGNDTQEELLYVDEISELKYGRELLQFCIEEIEHLNLQNVNLSDMAQIGIISDGLKFNNKITEVKLCNCRVTFEGIKVLVQAVEVSITLQKLYISGNVVSDDVVLSITNFLIINHTLFELNLSGNEIRDKGIKKLSEAIEVNARLQDLNMSSNKITDEGANELSKAMQVNKTLQELNISKNWISKEGVMRIVEACTKNRTLHKLVCTHNNLSKSELAAINDYIRKENSVQIFDASWNTIGTKSDQLAIKTVFQLLDNHKTTFQSSGMQQKLQSVDDITDANVELWFLDEITELQYRREFLQCEHLNVAGANLSDITQILIISDCLKVNKKIIEVNLSTNQLSNEGIKVFVQAVEDSTTLHSLDVSNNAISDDGVLFISDFLKINTLCKMNLSDNEIRDEGTKKFSEALQVNTTLQVLNISRNKITDDGANELIKAIQVNRTLQELNISKNLISNKGVMRIVKASTKNRTLHKLVCTHNNLSKSELAVINDYVKKENAIQIFDASWNSIVASGMCWSLIITTFQSLRWSPDGWEFTSFDYHKQVCIFIDGVWNDNSQCDFTGDSLKELNFPSHSIPSDLLVDIIQQVLEINTLQKLIIPSSEISDDGAIVFSECLKINKTLIELDLSSNFIRDEGASVIAETLMVNNTLQKLNISCNRFSDDGAIAFSEYLKTNTTLIELDLSGNIITYKGVRALAETLMVNNTLQKLNISHNRLLGGGAIAFSECLKTNTTLIELDLSGNIIRCKGAR